MGILGKNTGVASKQDHNQPDPSTILNKTFSPIHPRELFGTGTWYLPETLEKPVKINFENRPKKLIKSENLDGEKIYYYYERVTVSHHGFTN
jgi:hypothetical protein